VDVRQFDYFAAEARRLMRFSPQAHPRLPLTTVVTAASTRRVVRYRRTATAHDDDNGTDDQAHGGKKEEGQADDDLDDLEAPSGDSRESLAATRLSSPALAHRESG
jgi:hypothetical protein